MTADCGSASLSRYKDARVRCRCEGCTEANAKYAAAYYRSKVLAQARLTSSASARLRVIELHDAGVSYREVGRLADASAMVAYRVGIGAVSNIHRHTEAALLAIELPHG